MEHGFSPEGLTPVRDRAGEPYWTSHWQGRKLPRPVRVAGFGPRVWFHREFHHLWTPHLSRWRGQGAKLLEIGCAFSPWLPYFAREWGFRVAGLDYSAFGCRQTQRFLAREGVPGCIFHQDLFAPRPEQLQGYEVVFSNGVVEHFADPGAVVAQMGAYLRPGGLMITLVPNLTGLLGRLQSLLGPQVLATHTPLTLAELAEMHRRAGLSPVLCRHLAFLHFAVVNPDGRGSRRRRKLLLQVLKGLSAASALLRRLFPRLAPTPVTAAYLLCLAVKPGLPDSLSGRNIGPAVRI